MDFKQWESLSFAGKAALYDGVRDAGIRQFVEERGAYGVIFFGRWNPEEAILIMTQDDVPSDAETMGIARERNAPPFIFTFGPPLSPAAQAWLQESGCLRPPEPKSATDRLLDRALDAG